MVNVDLGWITFDAREHPIHAALIQSAPSETFGAYRVLISREAFADHETLRSFVQRRLSVIEAANLDSMTLLGAADRRVDRRPAIEVRFSHRDEMGGVLEQTFVYVDSLREVLIFSIAVACDAAAEARAYLESLLAAAHVPAASQDVGDDVSKSGPPASNVRPRSPDFTPEFPMPGSHRRSSVR